MKILFFIDSLRAGGKERRLMELLKGLRSSPNIKFEVVVMNENIHYKEIFDLEIKIHYLIRKTKKDLSIFYKFYKICKNTGPEIIHCWDDMTALYAIPSCSLLKIKLVNGMITNAPKWKFFSKTKFRSKLIFPFSDVIISNSQAGLIAYDAPISKSRVVYNGYNFLRNEKCTDNINLREQLKISTNYVVGMVATFSKAKDYKTYYQAASLILKKRTDVTFLSIGNNTDSAASQKLVDHYYLGENVKLLGRIFKIENYINIFDIGVLATFTEGISNAIMEYMALGKPVIATSGGGTNEIVENNKTGFLVNISDPIQIAIKINYLLDNEEMRRQMGQSGQKRINDTFSIDEMIHNYTSIYTQIFR